MKIGWHSLGIASMASQCQDTAAPAPTLKVGTIVAVTGATGFIGGRLVERLTEEGVAVTALLRVGALGTRLERTSARPQRLDLSDPESVRAALAGMEVVFHCAYDWHDEAWNLAAVRALIAGCRANGVRRFVHLSSMVVYQLPLEGKVTEESPECTQDAGYAYVKRQLEREIMIAVREDSFPGTILQPTIVYGPYSRTWTIEPAEMLRYGTVVLPDHGEGICNVVYVDDVVSAMILAAERPGAIGDRFLISGPGATTWGQFYAEIARAIGADGPKYWPAEQIMAASSKAPKLMRLVGHPALAIRRIAQAPPVRKLAQTGLDALPLRFRRAAKDWFFRPVSCWRDHVHVPLPGDLQLFQSRATIDVGNARRILSYAPQFDFATGMVPTGGFLQKVHAGGERTSRPDKFIAKARSRG